MIKLASVSGFLFALAAPCAFAAEPARLENGYIVNAPWAQKPTLEQAHDAYPPFALEHDIAGEAALDCLVEADGALSCAIERETPPDRSFGGASLGLARLYRMETALPDGTLTAGLRARLNMSYVPPPPPPPPPPGVDLLVPR